MKTPLLFLSLLVALAVTGCNTLTPAERLDQAAKVANLAAYMGAGLHLADHPEDRPYFTATVAALEALARSADYTPSTLAAALQTLPLSELRGSKGTLYLTAGVTLWDEAARQILRVDSSGAARAFAEAIRAGFTDALALTPRSHDPLHHPRTPPARAHRQCPDVQGGHGREPAGALGPVRGEPGRRRAGGSASHGRDA